MTRINSKAAAVRWPAERRVSWAIVGALALMAFLAAWATRSMTQFRATSQLVDHTYRIIAALERSSAALNEAISATRAFAITGDEQNLALADAAIARQRATRLELRELIEDPLQQQRLRTLDDRVERRIAILDAAVVAYRAGGLSAMQSVIATGQGRALLGEIGRLLEALETAERERLRERRERDAAVQGQLMAAGGVLLVVVAGTVLLGLVHLRRELRERRRLADELEAGRHFLASVIEHIPSMVFIKDARELRFVTFNRAGEQLLGMSREDLIGKSDPDLFPAEQAAAFVAADRRVLESRQLLDVPQEVIRTRAGEERLLHTRKVPIAGADGRPAFLLGVSEDITERVQAESRILALNASLQRNGAALEAANKELESFSYSVSHDLRAPLRAVASFALMLEEDCAEGLGPEGRRFVHVIRDNARRMETLIDDLLSFSRLGRRALSVAEIDMNALARQAAGEIVAGQMPVVPELVFGELPKVCGDRGLLYQVWMNLIGNAVKYSGKVGSPRVEIGGRLEGGDAVYHVKDNGAGFDMRYVGKLFGVFQRLHGLDEFPGSGVGLAIVHRIVTRHGGRVWAEGEPGKGACFHFALPVQVPAAEEFA